MSKAQMTANQRSINGLRYHARISLIIPNNLDIRRNRTVSYPDSALTLARARTPDNLNLPNCLYTKNFCKFFQSYEKNECNAKRKYFSFHFHNIAYFTACYSLNGDAK